MSIYNKERRLEYAEQEALKALRVLEAKIQSAVEFAAKEGAVMYIETKELHAALVDYATNFAVLSNLK